MIKFLTLSLILLSLGEAANPGVSVAISLDALNYAGVEAIDLLAENIKKYTLLSVVKNNGEEIKNIKVSRFVKPNVDVTLEPQTGLNIKLSEGEIEISGDYLSYYMYFFSYADIFHASSTNINLELDVAVMELNGKPKFVASNCNSELNDFEISSSGYYLSFWLYFSEGSVRREFESKMCSMLKDVINKNANKQLDTFNLIANITNNVRIDYRLTEDPVITSSYLVSNHKGKFLDDPQSSFNPPEMWFFAMRRMVSTAISEDTINSLGRVLHEKELIKFQIELENEALDETSESSNLDNLSNYIHLYSSRAPLVEITRGGLSVEAEFIIEIESPELSLELGVKVKTDGLVWISDKRIKGKIEKVKADSTVRMNDPRFMMTDKELNEITDVSIEKFLPKINEKLNEGFFLPNLRTVDFYNYQIVMAEKYIQIAFDAMVV